MGFREEYLQRCWNGRRMWAGKKTHTGDWYVTGDPPELKLVGEGEAGAVDFHDDAFAYVPDADDLLELLDNRIKAGGADPAMETLSLRYDPASHWCVDVEYGDNSTHAVKQDFIHSALLYALYLKAQPRP
ncbi:MAG: hypothetical protein ABSB61_13655 [Anaerolineales bacterium]